MVHFVGAGPGAPDLITVRAKTLLETTDVVIYAGSLVNPELLKLVKGTCAIYNSAELTLEEVIDIIKTAAHGDKDIVRLHTGDPSIYGAIREQIDRLRELNIAFDICPGVSSLFGAAAALEAEYTLPGVSQTVIITRGEGRTPVPASENLKSLAAHKATMAIFLSAGMLETVSGELIAGGYAPDTPAAIVYKATWPQEKIFRGKLVDLAKLGCCKKTALVVVGNILGSDYELSRLYDANFSTEFRKAK
ncbi:MAG: precorrin-4 C(11)-methyltransferase [Termitinemataceae bacterium]|nr:MAG: precorrin-4 C(11)-methyltransferase [Termitinemataceae bacterium]